jgi:hypothetical protein
VCRPLCALNKTHLGSTKITVMRRLKPRTCAPWRPRRTPQPGRPPRPPSRRVVVHRPATWPSMSSSRCITRATSGALWVFGSHPRATQSMCTPGRDFFKRVTYAQLDYCRLRTGSPCLFTGVRCQVVKLYLLIYVEAFSLGNKPRAAPPPTSLPAPAALRWWLRHPALDWRGGGSTAPRRAAALAPARHQGHTRGGKTHARPILLPI